MPTIVSPDLWERCAALRSQNMRLAPRNARRLYMLRGIVRCALCDRSMTGVTYTYRSKTGQTYSYYRCTSRADRLVENCALTDVRAEPLKRAVWSGIETFAQSPGKVVSKLCAALNRPKSRDEGRDVERALAAKLREKERVITWARQGVLTEAELESQLSQLRREIGALEDERLRAERVELEADSAREHLRDVESFLDEVARRRDDLTPEERAAIVRRAVPRVTVRPREGGRKSAIVTYRLSPPSILGTDPPPESP